MHFLPDVYVKCDVCKGMRYNRETLDIKYKGKSIADVLNMTVNQAADFLSGIPGIYTKLKTIQDVGLGYIRLGQSATTLSGGEAQRIKLAKELSKRSTGRTLYILDEPTTGLHFADIRKLLDVLRSLVEVGNTVVVIEHNLDVIKVADHIIDMGPEGGDEGGQVIATGTPEEVADVPHSYTGLFIRQVLSRERADSRDSLGGGQPPEAEVGRSGKPGPESDSSARITEHAEAPRTLKKKVPSKKQAPTKKTSRVVEKRSAAGGTRKVRVAG